MLVFRGSESTSSASDVSGTITVDSCAPVPSVCAFASNP